MILLFIIELKLGSASIGQNKLLKKNLNIKALYTILHKCGNFFSINIDIVLLITLIEYGIIVKFDIKLFKNFSINFFTIKKSF